MHWKALLSERKSCLFVRFRRVVVFAQLPYNQVDLFYCIDVYVVSNSFEPLTDFLTVCVPFVTQEAALTVLFYVLTVINNTSVTRNKV